MKNSKELAIARLAKACNRQGMNLLRGNDAIYLAERQLINVPNSHFFVGDIFTFPTDPADIVAFPMRREAPATPKALVTVKNKLMTNETFKCVSLGFLLGKVYSCDVQNFIYVNQCVADIISDASDVAEAFNLLAGITFQCTGFKMIDTLNMDGMGGQHEVTRQIPMFEVVSK